MPIAKTSGRNRVRIEALRMALEVINNTPGGMSVAQLTDAMNLSETGAKNYISTLMRGGCLSREVVKEEGRHPHAVYVVIASQAHIDLFMETLRYAAPNSPTFGMKDAPVQPTPIRHVHVAADDEPVKVKASRQRPVPYADLPREFFGQVNA